MSICKKRTIGEIYNGNDLSEEILNLPLTPFSEQFISYKSKLDKAISDLISLIKEQINKDEHEDLDPIIYRIRNLIGKNINISELLTLEAEIRSKKYCNIYLDIIQLEKTKYNIMECFIKWKNDHYYTRWEELNQPPQNLRELWMRFKEKISDIISSCKKIGSQPLPRLVISENMIVEEKHVAENSEKIRSSSISESGNIKNSDSELDKKLEKELDKVENDLIKKKDKFLENKSDKKVKGSHNFWGPKMVPKSKNKYISGISISKLVRKRIFNSNGRYKSIKYNEVSDTIYNMDQKLKSIDNFFTNKEDKLQNKENDGIIRNLTNWERVEEKRNNLKNKKYLLNFENDLQHLKNLDINNLLICSNSFSKGCKTNFIKNNSLEESNKDFSNISQNKDLFEKIRLEVELFNNGEIKDLKNLNELCTEFLKEYFNYESFREGQLDAIYSILLTKTFFENKSIKKVGSILILPTGYGKSLCFQFLSLLLNNWYKKVTIVITPLISLMQDQLRCLSDKIRGAIWNSNICLEERKLIIELIKNGNLDILFITPESIFSNYLSRGLLQNFNNNNNDLSKNNIGFLCIDEVHCICEWGHSFRPSYYSSINLLINKYKVERVLGITATATNDVLNELTNLLNIEKVIRPYFYQNIQRDNLKCKVLYIEKLKKKKDLTQSNGISINKIPKLYNNYTIVWDHIKYSVINNKESDKSDNFVNDIEKNNNFNGKITRKEVWSNCKNILIYVWQRSEVESVTNYLRNKGANALYYHGMMSSTERELVQKSFIKNMTNIFVATTSFGMGIDKKDIDAVIHWNMPNSLEQYIQETGRCARDMNRDGHCLLILSDEDYKLKRQVISSMVDKCSLRCLMHIILNNVIYQQQIEKKDNFHENDLLIDYNIYSIELFKKILNIKQNEEIEVLLYFIKPYLDFVLNKIYNFYYDWRYYIKGSPFIKIRCFDKDFNMIKKENEFFMNLSNYCTENSGVITLNLLEASKGMNKTLEYIEEEIESQKNNLKISIEKQTNKQCIIIAMIGNIKHQNSNENCDKSKKIAKLLLNKNQNLFKNWVDLIVENLYDELLKKNMNELWKLDIAFISFQALEKNKKIKENILNLYFKNNKKKLYNELFLDNEIIGFSKNLVDNLLNSEDENLIEKLFNDLINEMWFYKWNDELKEEIFHQENYVTESLKQEIFQKTKTNIKSSINFLLNSYLNNYSPVQWETYRISLEKIINFEESKKLNKEAIFKTYSTFDKFDIIFPGDICKILVGINSYRFSFKNNCNIKKELGTEIINSKLWGKFKNIPYQIVLNICEERFKEIAKEKFS